MRHQRVLAIGQGRLQTLEGRSGRFLTEEAKLSRSSPNQAFHYPLILGSLMLVDMQANGRDVELLLCSLADFGRLLSDEFSRIAKDDSLVGNVPISLLSRLDLFGPLRPSQIMEHQGLTSGGATKLIDRLEEAGLVERRRDVLPDDERAVLVVLTREGRELVRDLTNALSDKLGETENLVKEINRLLL